MKLLLSGFGVMAIVVACTGGGASTGPATYESALGPCRAECEQRIMCNPEITDTVEQCAMECAMEIAGWARDDVVQTVLECSAALPCDANDDGCLAMIEPLAIHRRWETECRAQLAGCADPTDVEGLCEVDGGPSGEAGLVRILAPVVIEAMLECLDDACEARLMCIDGVLDRFRVDL